MRWPPPNRCQIIFLIPLIAGQNATNRVSGEANAVVEPGAVLRIMGIVNNTEQHWIIVRSLLNKTDLGVQQRRAILTLPQVGLWIDRPIVPKRRSQYKASIREIRDPDYTKKNPDYIRIHPDFNPV